MKIIIKNIAVKAYNFIKWVEPYYRLFCQINTVIIAKLHKMKPKTALQIFFSALNNWVKRNNLITILLIFDNYFCITNIDTPLLILLKKV